MTNTNGTTQDYTVSAVLKTHPANSVHHFLDKKGYEVFIPFEGNNYYNGGSGEESWTGIFTVCFIQLKDGVNPERLREPVRRLLKQNSPENISQNLTVLFKPLDRYYLDTNNSAVTKTISILSGVALAILLLAVINFVNIMIGTSSYRIKEIGLRKVFGGRRNQLIGQYLVEAIMLTLLAGILSVFLYSFFRPFFNEVLNTTLLPLAEFHLREWIFLSAGILIVGLLAGIYPAFILSGSEVTTA